MRLIDADKLEIIAIDVTDLPYGKCLDVVLLEDIQNATTENVWIPVSKRLPETFVYVLVCTNHREIFIANLEHAQYPIKDKYWFGLPNGDFITMNQAIAWMPLPEPYKGGGTE